MTLPFDILHRTPQEAARRIVLGFLDQGRECAGRLMDDSDAEALHDFRVAVRRTRSALRAWRSELKGSARRKDERRFKAIQNATGGGRDTEVQLEWLRPMRRELGTTHRRGFDWLVDRLEARLGGAMDDVREQVLAEFDDLESSLRGRLETMTIEMRLSEQVRFDSFGARMAHVTREHFEELAVLLSRVTGPESEEAMHDARIRCKRLRYLVEPLAGHVKETRPLVKQCKALQEVLGDLNDTSVMRLVMANSLEEAAVAHARRLHDLVTAGDTEAMRREMRRSERPGLLEVLRRLEQRRKTLYERLEQDWLETASQPLYQAVDVFTRRVESLVEAGTEIERKYLLDGLPDLPEGCEMLELRQGYLPTKSAEERVRRIARGDRVRHVRTFKTGTGIQRFELEEDIDESFFDGMWAMTEGRRIEKRRWRVPAEDGLVWEIDEFLDRDLVLAEIELPDKDVVPEIPEWLEAHVVKEVTRSRKYKNQRLAC